MSFKKSEKRHHKKKIFKNLTSTKKIAYALSNKIKEPFKNYILHTYIYTHFFNYIANWAHHSFDLGCPSLLFYTTLIYPSRITLDTSSFMKLSLTLFFTPF
jgi:hypothetical protein